MPNSNDGMPTLEASGKNRNKGLTAIPIATAEEPSVEGGGKNEGGEGAGTGGEQPTKP